MLTRHFVASSPPLPFAAAFPTEGRRCKRGFFSTINHFGSSSFFLRVSCQADMPTPAEFYMHGIASALKVLSGLFTGSSKTIFEAWVKKVCPVSSPNCCHMFCICRLGSEREMLAQSKGVPPLKHRVGSRCTDFLLPFCYVFSSLFCSRVALGRLCGKRYSSKRWIKPGGARNTVLFPRCTSLSHETPCYRMLRQPRGEMSPNSI